ncbi:hypothetical protein BKI52_10050 [marine bacterium AO1-C]|nr:hypothetical protein BKI52_10050 [marine bacterium AO1-C]
MKHILLLETSTKFLLEQRDILMKRVGQENQLPFLNSREQLLWVDGMMDEQLYQKIVNYIMRDHTHMTNEMFQELVEYKMNNDQAYQGFMMRDYELNEEFLQDFDDFLLSYQQPPMHMLLMMSNKQDEFDYLLEREKIISFSALNLGMTTEEGIEKVIDQKRYNVRPFERYYQKHQRFQEINISGKSIDAIYQEIGQVINSIS